MDFDPNKDYYKILGVAEDASIDDIKKAFKKAAVKHHPDKWGNKEEFQKVNEAYQVIWNEQKKQQYDTFRKWGFGWFGGGSGFDFGNSGFGSGGGFDFGNVDFGDLMWGIFGGGFDMGRGRSRVMKWDDIKDSINITFEEAFLGVEKKIAYYRYVQTQGVESKTCEVCKGKWKTTKQMRTPFGVMQTQSVCERCGGSGKIYSKNWKELENGWLERVRETLDIKIPAGIKDWAYIKFQGKGNAGIGDVPHGDIYIQIHIAPSKIYERRGDNLYTKIELSIFDLVLGGEVQINHPEWKMKVKIPKWTQMGDMIKVSGKWFGSGGIFGKKWDMFLIPHVNIPKKLSREQERLWEDLKKKG
jgi:molecular chaperone DnaJ